MPWAYLLVAWGTLNFGAPVVDVATGAIIGVNNTVNEGGVPCDINNPVNLPSMTMPEKVR